MRTRVKILSVAAAFAMTTMTFCGTFGTASASSVDHNLCDQSAEYCLVCDLEHKINEGLPDADEITIENAATVIQQINDIDRIKWALTDEQYEELAEMVEIDYSKNEGYIVKYYEAIDALQTLGGVRLTISKNFLTENKNASDVSQAEVSFEIINLDSSQSSVLTLYDINWQFAYSVQNGLYQATSNGWEFTYVLPAGRYEISEINLDKPVQIDGKQWSNPEVSVEVAGQRVDDNTATVTLTDGEGANVFFVNEYNSKSVYKFVDEDGKLLTEEVKVTGTDFSGETSIVGSQTFERDFSGSGELTLTQVPDGYCLPDPIQYTFTGEDVTEGALHISKLQGKTTVTWTLYKHSYGEWTETKAATETEEGLRQRKCSSCQHIQEEIVPAKEAEGSYLVLLIIAGVFVLAVMMFIVTKKD